MFPVHSSLQNRLMWHRVTGNNRIHIHSGRQLHLYTTVLGIEFAAYEPLSLLLHISPSFFISSIRSELFSNDTFRYEFTNFNAILAQLSHN